MSLDCSWFGIHVEDRVASKIRDSRAILRMDMRFYTRINK